VPVGYVTNGVHMPSWDSVSADDLWARACGQDRWRGTIETLEHGIQQISDQDLWRCRNVSRQALVEYARERLSRDLAASGTLPNEAAGARTLFDPNTLTVGFARRFAAYKRPNLLLHDPQRLLRLLTNPARPVQLIIAGKAHPADHAGQELIQEWTHFIRQSPARAHVMFLSDYDMQLTEQLVRGVDLWLNTPRRPWEACGTSGMKVLVNGGINLSERDGWWAEAYSPEVGWALGDEKEHGDDPAHDAEEAQALYDVLEREVVPEFYSRDEHGVPRAWVARMRNSMARLTPRFSTNRSVREYTEQLYLAAALAYRERASDKGASGAAIVQWKRMLEQKWNRVSFGVVRAVTADAYHHFEVEVHLDTLEPEAVEVQLYADGFHEKDPVRQEMTCIRRLAGEAGGFVYGARVPATRPVSDYTARITAHRSGVSVPLEAAFILWQR
jgi:starch phosphorylase